MSTEEVARRLGVTAHRVRHIPARELPYRQLEARGRRAYAAGDVAEYLERRTVRS
jgi:DNA-binding transcriptional MerR regulator